MSHISLNAVVKSDLQEIVLRIVRLRDEPSDLQARLLGLRQQFERAIRLLVLDPTRAFPDHFERLCYVSQKHSLSTDLVTQLQRTRIRLNKIVHEVSANPSEQDVSETAAVLLALLHVFGLAPTPARTAPPPPPTMQPAPPAPPRGRIRPAEGTTPSPPSIGVTGRESVPVSTTPPTVGGRTAVAFARVFVLEVGTAGKAGHKGLRCRHEDFDDLLTVELHIPWADTDVVPYSTLALHTVEQVSPLLWRTTAESFVVLEPDVLVQATDIATCFQSSPPSHLLYVSSLLNSVQQTRPMAQGIVANTTFNMLLAENDGTPPESLLARACDAHAEALGSLPGEVDADVRRAIRTDHLEALTEIAARLRKHHITVEPALFTSQFGLQGRPDVLVERDQSSSYVVDLKTGKPPREDADPEWPAMEGVRGSYAKEAAQLVCYDLLLAGRGPTGPMHYLFYSAAGAKAGVRAIHVTYEARRDVIRARNRIIAAERTVLLPPSAETASLTMAGLPPRLPPYARESLLLAVARYRAICSPDAPRTDTFVGDQVRSVMQQTWRARLGGGTQYEGSGFASLWRERDLILKAASLGVLAFLRYARVETVDRRQLYHFTLDASKSQPFITAELRKDEPIVLYPHLDRYVDPLNGPIIKGRLKLVELGAAEPRVVVECYSATAEALLPRHAHWAIERDYLESSGRAAFPGLARLLSIDPNRLSLLLGDRAPLGPAPTLASTTTGAGTTLQQIAVAAAESQEYFLIQGPPGTGKTSTLLPAIVKLVLDERRTPVLLLAMSNRAVDEMRAAMSRHHFVLDPFREDRLSAPESPSAPGGASIVFRERLAKTEVYAMTVAQAQKRHAWLEAMAFDTVVVDEASQLLDSQLLGILSTATRFVLIGDQRQLPPIQPAVADADGESEGGEVKPSTFERLLDRCTSERWDYAYGMLEEQWRMHEEIQAFPSAACYGGRLRIGQPVRQRAREWVRLRPWTDTPVGTLFAHRVAFVSVPDDHAQEVRSNYREVEVIGRVIDELCSELGITPGSMPQAADATLGVIAPFRAQVAAISRRLHEWRHWVKVDTVERFQGSERDVMVISMTADNAQERTMAQSMSADGLIDRKLNVAITRAREHLIVVGHEPTMAGGAFTAQFLEHVRQYGTFVTAKELGLNGG